MLRGKRRVKGKRDGLLNMEEGNGLGERGKMRKRSRQRCAEESFTG